MAIRRNKVYGLTGSCCPNHVNSPEGYINNLLIFGKWKSHSCLRFEQLKPEEAEYTCSVSRTGSDRSCPTWRLSAPTSSTWSARNPTASRYRRKPSQVLLLVVRIEPRLLWRIVDIEVFSVPLLLLPLLTVPIPPSLGRAPPNRKGGNSAWGLG